MTAEKLRWNRWNDGSWGAGVSIGGDLARQWTIRRGPDRRWRASFNWLDTALFIGAAADTLAEQKKRVQTAADAFQHKNWP